MESSSDITQSLADHLALAQALLASEQTHKRIQQAADYCIDCLKAGGRVLLCGNGGSAADAQHIAAELSGRYLLDRAPLDAEALHVNPSYVTAVANDYSFDEIFARAVRAKGRAGDVLIGISTSGTSKNVRIALQTARQMDMVTIGLTGAGDQLASTCDLLIQVPSPDTPRIQEAHILIGHILCNLVEKSIFAP